MDESSRGIGGDHTQEPKDAQNDENSPKHCLLQSHKRPVVRELVSHPVFAILIFTGCVMILVTPRPTVCSLGNTRDNSLLPIEAGRLSRDHP